MRWFLPLVLLTACNFEPQGYSEQSPVIQDALLEHEVVLFGEMQIEYFDVNGSSLASRCTLEADVEGWYAEVPAAALPCDDCATSFEMTWVSTPEEIDGNCNGDEALRGSATFAVLPSTEYIPDDLSEYIDGRFREFVPEQWSAAPATGVATTNWTPAGLQEWDVDLGVYEPSNPSDEDWNWQFVVHTPYPWRTSAGYAHWGANLRLWDQ